MARPPPSPNLPPVDYINQLIQYRLDQIDYYRYLIELQQAQQNCLQQYQRQVRASNAMAQFNESFEQNFPEFRARPVEPTSEIIETSKHKNRQEPPKQDQSKAVKTVTSSTIIKIESDSEEEEKVQIIETTEQPTVQQEILQENSEIEDEDESQELLKCQTMNLKCIFAPECSQIFLTKAKLDHHLQEDHGTFQYRCLHDGCERSFYNSQTLFQHFQYDHPQVTEWKCSKCSRTYQSHAHLQYHHRNYHQSGKFMCSFPECSFLGQYRSDVYGHYEQRHQTYPCTHPGCEKSFRKIVHLKTHQRVHLGIKPYRCKWPNCTYASEDRSNTIKHIRIMHFRLPVTKKEQRSRKIVDHRNPKDFLEVVKCLLK